jgi:hypothetical protein
MEVGGTTPAWFVQTDALRQFSPSGAQGIVLLVRGDGVGILKKLIDMSDLERGADARVHPHQQKAVAILLMGHISPYQRPNSRRIRVGDIGKIENQQVGMVRPHLRLEIEEIGDHERSGEAQNPPSAICGRHIVNDERAVSHGEPC